MKKRYPIDARPHIDPRGGMVDCMEISRTISSTTTPQELVAIIEEKTQGHFDVDCPGRIGWTLLMAAAMRNNLPLVKWLVDEKGANVNYANQITSPLPLACFTLNVEMVKYLLAKDASPHFYLLRDFPNTQHLRIMQYAINTEDMAHRVKVIQEDGSIEHHHLCESLQFPLDEEGNGKRTQEVRSINYTKNFHNPLFCTLAGQSRNPLGNLKLLDVEHLTREEILENQGQTTEQSKAIVALLLDAGCDKGQFAEFDCVKELVEKRVKTKALLLFGIYRDPHSTLAIFKNLGKGVSSPLRRLVESVTYYEGNPLPESDQVSSGCTIL